MNYVHRFLHIIYATSTSNLWVADLLLMRLESWCCLQLVEEITCCPAPIVWPPWPGHLPPVAGHTCKWRKIPDLFLHKIWSNDLRILRCNLKNCRQAQIRPVPDLWFEVRYRTGPLPDLKSEVRYRTETGPDLKSEVRYRTETGPDLRQKFRNAYFTTNEQSM